MPITEYTNSASKTYKRLRIEAPFMSRANERWDEKYSGQFKTKVCSASLPTPYGETKSFFWDKLNYRNSRFRETSQLKVGVRYCNKNKILSEILSCK